MNPSFLHQKHPVSIPVGPSKEILEHFGRVATQTDDFSVAKMKAHPHWEEPSQIPDFDELTLMVSGKMEVTINDSEERILHAGESLWIRKGVSVRYRNPFDEPNEYWAICFPAFSPESAHRIEE